jgi:radical SAM modification target selenobiotic family peptide
METQDLKKYLAGFSIAGLLAGAGLVMGAGTCNAADNSANGKDGSSVTTEQTITKSSLKVSYATPTSEPTPTGG